MSPVPSGSHSISLQEAIEMTSRYRSQRETVLTPAHKGILLTCETFNRSAFDALLAEPDCVGIRIYFGMAKDLTIKLIAVGLNEKDEDILPSAISTAEDDKTISENGLPCPPVCPPSSPLNG